MSFLKFIALAVVKTVVQFGLLLIISICSQIQFLKPIMYVVTIKGASDVIAGACLLWAYGVCDILAEKMNAKRPFSALLITDMVFHCIGIILCLLLMDWNTIWIDIVAIGIGFYFFSQNKNN